MGSCQYRDHVHQLEAGLSRVRFRKRTPRTPPFSSMTSTCGRISNARRMTNQPRGSLPPSMPARRRPSVTIPTAPAAEGAYWFQPCRPPSCTVLE